MVSPVVEESLPGHLSAVDPLVSILIPAYNAQMWVADTLGSALAQTWPRKEIIVVDDGSTDQTLAIARQFASSQVSVVSQPNQGAAAARNKAFSVCQGDYVQWLDADDLLAPDKIAKQIEESEKVASDRTLLSGGWAYFMYRSNKAKFVPTVLWQDLSPLEWLCLKMERAVFMQTGTWLASRKLTEDAGPWDTRLLGDDDGEYFCRVLLASESVRFVPEAKAFYRISGPESLSYVGQSDRKLEAHLLSIKLHIKHLRSMEDSARTRMASLNQLKSSLISFYPERPDLVEQYRSFATELGGQLDIPQLSWKYAWIQKIFGWAAAKRAQLAYNRFKLSLLRSWDRLLFRLNV
jgi:glycosyltransferase involved in cell wall biosynthesis